MEVVEDVEESILRALAHQVLDVVNDQHVDLLVEGHEVGELVADGRGVDILGLELVAGHVEDLELRELLFDGDTDSLREVRLAEPRTAEDKQRIERGLSGRAGDVDAGGDAHLVALALDEVREAIGGIQPGVDVDFLQAGIDERAGRRAGAEGADRDRRVHRGVAAGGGIHHLGLVVHRTDHIDQLRIRADDAAKRHLQHVEKRAVEILAEEIRRHLHGQHRLLEGDGADRAEPGLELLRLNDLLNDLETVIPDIGMSCRVYH